MKKYFLRKCVIAALLLVFAAPFPACNKLVQVPPPSTTIADNNVYTSDANAIAVITGIYEKMSGNSLAAPGDIPSLSLFAGLSADELTWWSGTPNVTMSAYYRNALSGVSGGAGSEYWAPLYNYIYSCNLAVEGLNASTGLTPAVKQQLLGEAHFLRGFFYFYLTNLFGNLPMPLSSDYTTNARLARVGTGTVYAQITADCQQAAALLNTSFVDGTLLGASVERVRPTKWAAQALLARTYLYMGHSDSAAAEADSVIGNTGMFSLSPLATAFLRAGLGNNEAIWQLQPVNTGLNTEDAVAFIIPATGPGGAAGVYLSDQLLGSFEPGDQRRVAWTDSTVVAGTTYYYAYKYKVNTQGAPVTEYLTLLRLGEMYLVRSEARAMQGDLAGAAADLNMIRARAGLGPSNAVSEQDLLTAIWHERQVELFTELGHRWLDLKRTARVDSVMGLVTPLKGGSWQSYQQLYPLPPSEIQLDPNVVQNPGY